MKPKLWNFLTVCLLTLVVLAPALLVISVVWQEHLNFVATQHLLYAVTDAKKLTNHGEKTIFDVLLSLMYFAPIGFLLGIALHDRYVVYRAAVRQRKIEMLERIWHSGTYSISRPRIVGWVYRARTQQNCPNVGFRSSTKPTYRQAKFPMQNEEIQRS